MNTELDLSADYINVSDITDRVDSLRDVHDELSEAVNEAEQEQIAYEEANPGCNGDDDASYGLLQCATGAARDAIESFAASDEGVELTMLESMLSDLCGCGGDHQWNGDWYPATLIAESAFESAMDELLEDIGDLPKDLPSYLKITVDYDALRQDYSSVTVDGADYLYR